MNITSPRVLPRVAACCRVLPRVAACCRVLPFVITAVIVTFLILFSVSSAPALAATSGSAPAAGSSTAPSDAEVDYLHTPDGKSRLSSKQVVEKIRQAYDATLQRSAKRFREAGEFLFWSLVIISMVYHFGMMALKRSDFGDFYVEIFKFILSVGFFYFLLDNGPDIAKSIFDSFYDLAMSVNPGVKPSDFMDSAFKMLSSSMTASGEAQSQVKTMGVGAVTMAQLCAFTIFLVTLSLMGNLLLLSATTMCLIYSGVLLLGFGGCRWTSDMAINYLKTVLQATVQLMVFLMVLGIGQGVLNSVVKTVQSEVVTPAEMSIYAAMLIVVHIITTNLPKIVSGIVGGSHLVGDLAQQFGHASRESIDAFKNEVKNQNRNPNRVGGIDKNSDGRQPPQENDRPDNEPMAKGFGNVNQNEDNGTQPPGMGRTTREANDLSLNTPGAKALREKQNKGGGDSPDGGNKPPGQSA